jgi:alpha-glucosidase
LLGSHDTARIFNVVAGHAARNRLAIAMLLTYPGVPSIYYGDEIGLSAGSRECMNWKRSTWDHELYAYYRALIHLRRTSPALIDGGFQVILTDDETLAYVRDAEEDCVIVVAQRGPGERPASGLGVAQAAIPDGVEFVDVISGAHSTVVNGHLPLPALPIGATIWRAKS